MPSVCPNCGEVISEDAAVCPECGSDEKTGWSDRATGQRLDLSEDDFDYDGFVREEFRAEEVARVKPHGMGGFWWWMAVGLLALIVWRFVFAR